MARYKFSKKQCNEWIKNKKTNPKTGYSIDPSAASGVYKKLKRQCGVYEELAAKTRSLTACRSRNKKLRKELMTALERVRRVTEDPSMSKKEAEQNMMITAPAINDIQPVIEREMSTYDVENMNYAILVILFMHAASGINDLRDLELQDIKDMHNDLKMRLEEKSENLSLALSKDQMNLVVYMINFYMNYIERYWAKYKRDAPSVLIEEVEENEDEEDEEESSSNDDMAIVPYNTKKSSSSRSNSQSKSNTGSPFDIVQFTNASSSRNSQKNFSPATSSKAPTGTPRSSAANSFSSFTIGPESLPRNTSNSKSSVNRPNSSMPRSSAGSNFVPRSSAPSNTMTRSSVFSNSVPKSSAGSNFVPSSLASSNSIPRSSAPSNTMTRSSAFSNSVPRSSAPSNTMTRSSAFSNSVPRSSAFSNSMPKSSAGSNFVTSNSNTRSMTVNSRKPPSSSNSKKSSVSSVNYNSVNRPTIPVTPPVSLVDFTSMQKSVKSSPRKDEILLLEDYDMDKMLLLLEELGISKKSMKSTMAEKRNKTIALYDYIERHWDRFKQEIDSQNSSGSVKIPSSASKQAQAKSKSASGGRGPPLFSQEELRDYSPDTFMTILSLIGLSPREDLEDLDIMDVRKEFRRRFNVDERESGKYFARLYAYIDRHWDDFKEDVRERIVSGESIRTPSSFKENIHSMAAASSEGNNTSASQMYNNPMYESPKSTGNRTKSSRRSEMVSNPVFNSDSNSSRIGRVRRVPTPSSSNKSSK